VTPSPIMHGSKGGGGEGEGVIGGDLIKRSAIILQPIFGTHA
jgi:hypothetical protein